MNREDWLTKCVDFLRPQLIAVGHPVTDDVRITCGWPSAGGLSTKKRVIGQCWEPSCSADGTVEIFVSPLLDDSVEVAAVVAHELIHGSGIKGHRRNFASVADKLGLDGPATATVAGEVFREAIAPFLAVGSYPHAHIDYTKSPRKKQTTRLLKVECLECAAEDEPYIVRMSLATLERGAPICPIHEVAMGEAG